MGRHENSRLIHVDSCRVIEIMDCKVSIKTGPYAGFKFFIRGKVYWISDKNDKRGRAPVKYIKIDRAYDKLNEISLSKLEEKAIIKHLGWRFSKAMLKKAGIASVGKLMELTDERCVVCNAPVAPLGSGLCWTCTQIKSRRDASSPKPLFEQEPEGEEKMTNDIMNEIALSLISRKSANEIIRNAHIEQTKKVNNVISTAANAGKSCVNIGKVFSTIVTVLSKNGFDVTVEEDKTITVRW